MTDKSNMLYRVIFLQEDKIYEIYSRFITEESLMGFIEAEELMFDENTTLVVDPSEEKLKAEFTGVRRTYIPQHLILRIDEVEKKGTGKIKDGGKKSNVSHFPGRKPTIIKDPADKE